MCVCAREVVIEDRMWRRGVSSRALQRGAERYCGAFGSTCDYVKWRRPGPYIEGLILENSKVRHEKGK